MMERNINLVRGWQRRNNLLIFGTEACYQETYIDTLKIAENILRLKRRVKVLSWLIHVECVRIMGKEKEERQVLITLYFVHEEIRSVTRNQKSGGDKGKNRARLPY